MSAAAQPPIDPRILEEAADWLVQLHAGKATQGDRQACDRWRQRSPEHARAWTRAEQLMGTLGGLPPELAMPSLDRPTRAGRRAAVTKLAAWLAIAPAGLAAWHWGEGERWTADHRTAVGERRDIQLADGSRVTLNTASAIDLRFDASQRLIRLVAGEILVQTARDPSAIHRPLRVATAEGLMEALGTRFSVRQDSGRTHIAVLQGAVRIEPRGSLASEHPVLQAGQQTSFTASQAAPAQPADDTAVAWTQGMLLADRMRLADFAAELARYRQGLVRCDPAIADLRIAGAFPIADTDRALTMLEATYPVRAAVRWHGHWVTLVPAAH